MGSHVLELEKRKFIVCSKSNMANWKDRLTMLGVKITKIIKGVKE